MRRGIQIVGVQRGPYMLCIGKCDAHYAKAQVCCVLCAGGFKLWECSVDLIEAVRKEIQDGHLSFRGKDVLEVCVPLMLLRCTSVLSSKLMHDFLPFLNSFLWR